MIYIFERLKTFKFGSVGQTGIQLERKKIAVMYKSRKSIVCLKLKSYCVTFLKSVKWYSIDVR